MMKKTLENKGILGFAGILTIKRIRNGEVVEVLGPFKNKVVSGSGGYGRNLVLRQLMNDTTYPIVITTASAGSGTNAPADSDTNLQTPVVTGISVSNYALSNNVLTIDVFASSSTLTNGTYSEFGLFCSGRLFARILISPSYTKATGEDTIFTYELTSTG